MNRLCIDRIEGSFAVCQDAEGNMHSLPLSALPPGAGEGDFLRESASGWELDAAAKSQAEEKNAARLRQLLQRQS